MSSKGSFKSKKAQARSSQPISDDAASAERAVEEAAALIGMGERGEGEASSSSAAVAAATSPQPGSSKDVGGGARLVHVGSTHTKEVSREAELRADLTTLKVSPPLEMKKFEKVLFHSLKRDQLTSTVGHWHCAIGSCERSNRNDGFGPHRIKTGVVVAARVLDCGHYLCQPCYDEHRDLASAHKKDFTCKYEQMNALVCGKVHEAEKMSSLPEALHITKYLAALVAPGFGCNPCIAVNGEKPTKRRDRERFPQFPLSLTQAHGCMFEPSWTKDAKPLSINTGIGCMYCVAEDARRKKKPFCCSLKYQQGWFSWTGIHDFTEQKLPEAGKERLKTRSPWHLKMFDYKDLIEFATEILSCKLCKDPYMKSGARPMIIDCGHIVCSDCADLIIAEAGKEHSPVCPFDGCSKSSKTAREALDIAWVVGERTEKDFVKCTKCEYNHVHEMCTQWADSRTKGKMLLCFYCITKDQPENFRALPLH